MNQTQAPRPLTGPLRARINGLAHANALQHETRLRASLIKQVQTARDDGASFDELAALVAGLEAAPPEAVGGLQKSGALTGRKLQSAPCTKIPPFGNQSNRDQGAK